MLINKDKYIYIYMPGVVLGFDDNSNTYLSNLFNEINLNDDLDLIKISIVPHISLMRFQNIENIENIKPILETIAFEDFKINIKGISIYRKSHIKYVLVLDPIYDENISNIHKIIWEKLENVIELKESQLYNPSICSLHLTINLNEPNKLNVMKVLELLMDIPSETFQLKANKFLVIDKGTVHYEQPFLQTGNGLPLIYFNK